MAGLDSWIMHASGNVNKYLLEIDWLFWLKIGGIKKNQIIDLLECVSIKQIEFDLNHSTDWLNLYSQMKKTNKISMQMWPSEKNSLNTREINLFFFILLMEASIEYPKWNFNWKSIEKKSFFVNKIDLK